jgi:hypothetical protein
VECRVLRYKNQLSAAFELKSSVISHGLNSIGKLLFVAVLGYGSAVAQTTTTADSDFTTGTRLANMLRASRGVISAKQPLINDADLGNKMFTGDRLVNEAESNYAKLVGSPLIGNDLSARDRRLLEAQKQAMRKVMDAHQEEINRPGVGFKGFIPAIFARLANEEFGTIAGQDARIRVTAPSDLVRNRKARPDSWEKNIIDTRLLSSNWPKGKTFTEEVEYEGRPAFRMLLPEYYSESCLACHGEPRGEMDITSYPKEGGKIGDLGGAISIVIFR